MSRHFLKIYRQPTFREHGFTLIEMIGVLAIMAILIALLLPKVFKIIASSNAQSLATAVRTYETSLVRYYADVRSLYPLNAAGIPQVENGGQSTTIRSLPARLTLDKDDPLNVGTGSWPNFRGPYLEKFDSANPPGLGSTMTMPARAANNFGAAPTFNQFNFDLDGDNVNDIIDGAQLVYLFVDDVPQARFDVIDDMLDPGIGVTLLERQTRGRVKWQAGSGGQLRLYLVSD